MRLQLKSRTAVAAALVASGIGFVAWEATLYASDHSEAPRVQADAAQDITDLYVFESPTNPNNTVIVVCWAGLSVDPDHLQGLGEPASTEGLFDPAALYTIHIDNNADNVADIKIHWRYGTNAAGDTGIQWSGIPETSGAVVHAVEEVYEDASGMKLWSGHADDPFFFDAVGYLTTLDTGALSFDNTRDTLAGLNVTAVAIEIETSKLGQGAFQVWTTASRKGS